MKVLVVGANGQIGKHLITYLNGHTSIEARAMIRDEVQASFFKENGAEVVVCDLEEDVPVIAEAAKGCDALVFTAGSGPHTGKDKTLMVDLDGAVKTVEAAKVAGIKRYVMISSLIRRERRFKKHRKGSLHMLLQNIMRMNGYVRQI